MELETGAVYEDNEILTHLDENGNTEANFAVIWIVDFVC